MCMCLCLCAFTCACLYNNICMCVHAAGRPSMHVCVSGRSYAFEYSQAMAGESVCACALWQHNIYVRCVLWIKVGL